MKKLILVALIFLVSMACMAQTIQYRDDATLDWDVVAQAQVQVGVDGNGEPIVEDVQSIEYEIFREPFPVADRTVGTSLGITSLITLGIVVPNDALTYAFGVRTIYTTVTATMVYSSINWSDVNGLATPLPFLYRRLDRVRPVHPMAFRGD